MRPSQVGGIFIVAASVCYVVGLELGFALVDVALIIGSIGTAIVAITEPDTLSGPAVRIGLGGLALGLMAFAVGAVVNDIALGVGTDPLATPAILFDLVGLCATLIGLVVTGVSLALRPGLTRLVGGLLLAGPVCVGLALPVASARDIVLPIGVLALTVGCIGLGGLAIYARGDRSSGAH
jgi:hypothetical protein